jgi:hypothetical protein
MNNEYRNRYQQIGAIKTDSIIKWESHVAKEDSGWACTLYYVVHYTKSTANEMVSLSKENDSIKINNYRILSQ